jgi:sugar/nucleoside kinase (ribokinase family)
MDIVERREEENMAEVVVAGHICLDLTPRIGDTSGADLAGLLHPGKLLNVGDCVVSAGGCVPNTGLALIALGVPTDLMAQVGEGPFGQLVMEIIRARGGGSGMRVSPGAETAYSVILAPPGIDRIILHHPGANDSFAADDIDYTALDVAALFHFGYPPLMARMYADGGRELVDIFARAKERGVTTSLDMALPDPGSPAGVADWRTILTRTLPEVDVFVPSIEEAFYCLEKEACVRLRAAARARDAGLNDLLSAEDFQRLAGQLIADGAGIVLLKAGERGMYLRTAGAERLTRLGRAALSDPVQWANRELWVTPYRAPRVASTTGAGDCAIAGFLAALLRGETAERQLMFAAAAGAQNVTAYDTLSGLRSYSETSRQLEQAAPAEMAAPGEGWYSETRGRIWVGPNDRVAAG